jgi:hypothetical protein
MGASEGTGDSPTAAGNCAPATEVQAASAKAARLKESFMSNVFLGNCGMYLPGGRGV